LLFESVEREANTDWCRDVTASSF